MKRPIMLLALLFIALVFGTGGRNEALSNLVVQLAALAVLALSLDQVRLFLGNAPRGLILLIALTIALPLLQLVPLPPSVWQSLPGREIAVSSLELVGRSQEWMPFSLNSGQTIVAFIGLLPPLAILVLAFGLSGRDRKIFILGLAVFLILLLMLAAIQLGSNGGAFDLYPGHEGRLTATFANANTAGVFFVIAACLAAGQPWEERWGWAQGVGVRVLLFTVLAVVVALTQSRSSLVLLPIPFLVNVFAAIHLAPRENSKARIVVLAGAGILAAAILALAVTPGGSRFDRAMERFENLEDNRSEIWSDAYVAAERYWPVGSGMGTFDEAFQLDESLERVSQRRAGRAHNDYLEIALEAGVVGLALVLAWILYLSYAFLRANWRGIDLLSVACAAGLLAIAGQSLVDYPLRNEALFCIAASLVAFLHFERRKGSNGGRVEVE